MERRTFILKTTSFLVCNLFGWNFFSKAYANTINPKKISQKIRISLIIDDIGHNINYARNFIDLKIPITYSILPRISHSQTLADEIHRQGHEIMLHQPMEPYNSKIDPGPGALYVGDNSRKIIDIIDKNITEMPFAVGVNNHMGSRFTECVKETNEALNVIKNRGLFFVDSLTSNRSVAHKTALQLHMTSTCRNKFLDNVHEEDAILSQLNKLYQHAKKNGHAVGIGHPYPETARSIHRFTRLIKHKNVEYVYVSSVFSS